MNKNCQIALSLDAHYVCGKLLKKTGQRYIISKEICDKHCTQFVRSIIRFPRTKKNLQTPSKPPTVEQMQADYEKASSGVRSADNPQKTSLIDWQEYLRHRNICIKCGGGYRCPHYCCGIIAQLALKTWKCKEEKF